VLFFIENKPVLALEKGDVFEPITLDLSAYFFIIINPNIQISTPEAYSWVKASKKENSLKNIINLPIDKWKDNLHNNFEEEVFKHYPEIELLKNRLYDLGAVYSAMTGSGAAVFGIFEMEIDVKDDFLDYYIWYGKGMNI